MGLLKYIKDVKRKILPGVFDLVKDQRGVSIYDFREREYPQHQSTLNQKKQGIERYQEGIFEVENDSGIDAHITKRASGLVRAIEDSSEIYSSAAFMVESKEKPKSILHIKTLGGKEGAVDFPHRFSLSERDAVLNRTISYEERYDCYDEGAFLGLLQGWHYTLEVLDGPNKGLKLEEDITV